MSTFSALLAKQKSRAPAITPAPKPEPTPEPVAAPPIDCKHETGSVPYRVFCAAWSNVWEVTHWYRCLDCSGGRNVTLTTYESRVSAETEYFATQKAIREFSS